MYHFQNPDIKYMYIIKTLSYMYLPNEYELALECFGKIVLPFTLHFTSCSLYNIHHDHLEYSVRGMWGGLRG